MSKVKILHFELDDDIGGIETFLYNVYKNIDREKYEFHFITVKENPGLGNELTELGGTIHRVSSYKNIIKYMFDIYRIVKEDFLIVHVHKNSAANIIPLLVAKISGAKIIVHSHNTSTSEKKVYNLIHYFNRPIMNRLVDKKLACSKIAGEWLYGKNSSFEIISNGIDLEKYRYSECVRNKIKDEFGIQNSVVIGHVGRFNFQKNHEFLVDVFFELSKIVPNAILILVGNGELFNNIKDKVSKLGISKKVLFLGERSDVNEILQCFDIFVMPSLFEGLPIAGIEAQAAGLPVLASDTISCELDITEYVNKLSLNESPKVWANAAKEMIEKNSRNVESFSLKKYSINNTVSSLQQIYSKLI